MVIEVIWHPNLHEAYVADKNSNGITYAIGTGGVGNSLKKE